MAESRNTVTIVSVTIALLAVGWGVYVTQRSARVDRLNTPENAQGLASDSAAQESPTRPAGSISAGSAMAGERTQVTSGAATAVITAAVQSEKLATQLTALGTAHANESVDVTSKTSNMVTAVHFRDGQSIRQGDVLATLDGAQARADLAEAEAARADSASQVKRSRELLSTRIISEVQYDQLEATLKANEARVAAARSRLDDTIIRAPFSGRVGLRRVSVGSLVNPGTTITTLDDSSVIKVDFSVPENFLAGLREGLQVVATAAAFPDREFAGSVAGVDSRVDPVSRSVTVRALVPNPQGLLKPGMFLNVRLARDEREALMIPEAALMPEQSRQFLYVVKGGVAARREVRIGRRQPGKVEITAGLQSGERVVVEGTQKVRDGAPVRELQDQASAAIPAARR